MTSELFSLEKIHQINDLEWAKHELIWNLLGLHRIYIRIFEKETEFYPTLSYPISKLHILRFVLERFQTLYYREKRGIFESLYIIELELRKIVD